MTKAMRAALVICAMAQAANVNAQENAVFDAAVRASLLRNPDVVLEVFKILEEQQNTKAVQQDIGLIEKYSDELFGNIDIETPVLVEFVDYQCGYCRRAHSETLLLLEQHPTVTIVQKQFPILGPKSVELAERMLAIKTVHGDVVFQEMNDALMGDDGRIAATFDDYITAQGLDAFKIREVATSEEVQAEISATHALARALSISGTPGFVSRTKIIRGFSEVEGLEVAVFGRGILAAKESE